MIRHIVMFSFREADGRTRMENAGLVKEKLDALPAILPCIRHFETHLKAPGFSDQNFDLILISEFENRRDLEEYANDPDHKAVGAFMAPFRTGRAAIDFEV